MSIDVAIDLTRPTRIHIVGLGGAGMSAIAEVLAAMGHEVSGSDLRESGGLERLRSLGVTVSIGHDRDHVGDVDVVAISTAIPERNVEVRAALEQSIPVLRRAQILAAITSTRRTIAVGGTHGKTTTSSMLALVLREAGLAPSFIIGGEVNEIGSGAVWDEGEWLVVEADESDGTFVELVAEAAIVTSVEPDHLEHYGGVDGLFDAFGRFMVERPGPVVVCADDPLAMKVATGVPVVTYGTSVDADYRMAGLRCGAAGSHFVLEHVGQPVGEVRLPVPGAHNALNGCAALALALEIGAPFDAGAAALRQFAGVARRFQFRGTEAGVTFVDDYAHLPTEVGVALDAARDGDWDRIVCVFQPHRFSRTAALWADFADAFTGADVLAVTDIYPAGEAPRPGVSGRLVLDAVLDAHPWRRAAWLPRRADLVSYLTAELRPGDLCLTLGAGDLTSLADEVQDVLAAELASSGVAGR